MLIKENVQNTQLDYLSRAYFVFHIEFDTD